MKELLLDDLKKLRIGSAILGSGGGGDSSLSYLMAKHLVEKYGPVSLINREELNEDDFIIPIAMMGAPTILKEKLPNGKEFDTLLKKVEEVTQRKPTVVMSVEIGGANAFTPIIAACLWKIPILDADLIGRAFPELPMNSCYLNKMQFSEAVVADSLGNAKAFKPTDLYELEEKARALTIEMGSASNIGFYFMDKDQAVESVIPDTFSKAIALGGVILEARKHGRDPVNELLENSPSKLVATGSVVDIDHYIEAGFLQGNVSILANDQIVTIHYKNEFLVAQTSQSVLASTPDLIVVLDQSTGEPIASENLKYGLQVAVVAIEAPDIWQSSKGLKIVGPEVFGYQFKYKSIFNKGGCCV